MLNNIKSTLSAVAIKYGTIIAVSIVIILLIQILLLKHDIRNINSKLESCSKLKIELEVANDSLQDSNNLLIQHIEEQNSEIQKYSNDLNKRNAEYQKLLKIPEKEKYKEIYNKNPMMKEKSNAYEDITNLLDSIRNTTK